MKVAWTEITLSNRKVKESARSPAVRRASEILSAPGEARTEQSVLASCVDRRHHPGGRPELRLARGSPGQRLDGGQPGGNLRVVFLFNPARVSFIDAGGSGVNRSTTGTQVITQKNEPTLSLSPGRIDPTNPVWTASRKPLVGEFSFRGKDVFVIANHFDSKLGDQNADGRFQFPAQSSATQRVGQALVEHDFINQILAMDKADVVVVGDLNYYQ